MGNAHLPAPVFRRQRHGHHEEPANQVVLVADTSQDPGWMPNPLLPETQSEIAVPIAIGERVLGVLDVQHNVVGVLDEGDAELLRSIANQVAIAVRNAQLYALAQQKAEHETVLSQITQRIQTATTVEGVLQVAVRELSEALGAQRASIQLDSHPANGDGQGRKE